PNHLAVHIVDRRGVEEQAANVPPDSSSLGWLRRDVGAQRHRGAHCRLLQIDPALKVITEQLLEISADLSSRHRPAVLGKYPIGLREQWRHSAPGISPLVDYLLEYAGVRMLRDEAVAQHLDPLPRHLLDDGRIVQKPPATKRQKVAEFASVDTEFVLV